MIHPRKNRRGLIPQETVRVFGPHGIKIIIVKKKPITHQEN